MTEKIESMEIYPMRGHSRGEWYCSLEDTALSEEEAEYWAVFGETHRGNKHCLGEFPTRADAEFAIKGMRNVRDYRYQSSAGRKIIQIEVVSNRKEPSLVELFALCDDGSIWQRGVGIRRVYGFMDQNWRRVPLDGIDGLAPNADIGWWLCPTKRNRQ